jgi:hypothetical protein
MKSISHSQASDILLQEPYISDELISQEKYQTIQNYLEYNALTDLTIQDCIHLLNADGINSKQQVKIILQSLLDGRKENQL